ncbi:P-type ATPase [Nocardia sp. R6R-6]|uniref:P-type ATPase n=1 Tax=Nocardia sp. R6R-6 TaxID=3459303 RepID=UPI00403DA7C6
MNTAESTSKTPARRVFREAILVAVIGVLGAAGLVARPFSGAVADVLWLAATAIALVPAAVWVFQDLRRGRYGADLLALVALVGAAAVSEYFAGALIALMVATGRVLEAYASRRAGRDLSALLRRAPVQAHRRHASGIETVAATEISPGDVVVVLPGETVPVDGVLTTAGVFDESALTGESVPVARRASTEVRSGVVNAGAVVDIRASATVGESTYAGIVTLARQAAATAARLADRVNGSKIPSLSVLFRTHSAADSSGTGDGGSRSRRKIWPSSVITSSTASSSDPAFVKQFFHTR